MQFDPQNNFLQLKCCWVDSIEAVGTVLVVENHHHGFSGKLRIPAVSHVLGSWREVAQLAQRKQYVTLEPMLDAFIQTLLVGPSGLSIEFLRQQYDILDKATNVAWWMDWLGRVAPKWLAMLVLPLTEARYLWRKRDRAFAFDFRIHLSPAADRRLFRTERGYIGMASARAEPGDRVAVAQGGKVPLVLRPDGTSWKLRGDCYLHGIMRGEAYDDMRLNTICIS